MGAKYPSLLKFEESLLSQETVVRHNLEKLYGIKQVPSDTYLREELDEVSPNNISPAFKMLFAQLQRAKKLEGFTYLDGHYLMSVDGTGFFSSKKISCVNCCIKNHRDNTTSYYHFMHCAAIVHPELKEVIPLAPEAIIKQDGHNKNDCEQQATKRLLTKFRREHPHLKTIVLEDSLHANGPHIALLKELDLRFILSGKQYAKDFNFIEPERIEYHDFTDEVGHHHKFRWVNCISLNGNHPNLMVNILDYQETTSKGKILKFTWVTDLSLTKETVYKIMRGGRARWRIENETFNTLKNQGYQFEHNFGHGNKNLSTVFANLMMLAFLIDQIQQIGCKLFQHALIKARSKSFFWEKFRSLVLTVTIDSWDILYGVISGKFGHKLVLFDTS